MVHRRLRVETAATREAQREDYFLELVPITDDAIQHQ